MTELTGIGIGLMLAAVGVAVGGLALEATMLMLGRALRRPPMAAALVLALEKPE